MIIATAVAALSEELFGFGAQWLWTIVFGGIALVLALLGPVDFVRKFVRKFAVWAVLASLVYLSWWALDGAGIGELLDRPGEGGTSVLEGADLVVAITVSWIPLAADYTRFSRTRRAAFWGTGVGYLVASAWLWALGAILFFSRDITDAAALPAAVVAGGVGAAIALFAVTVDETDEAFANVYSTAVSLQNLAPRMPQRALIVAVAAVATLGALTIDLLSYETFLILLGSFFVPLFGVLLADWLVAGAQLPRERRLLGTGRPPRHGRELDRRLRPVPVAASRRAGLVGRPRRSSRPARRGDRRDAAELRARVRARRRDRDRRSPPLLGRRFRAVRGMAVIGNLARDVVGGGPPRSGGAPIHAARALRLLGGRTRIVARCARADRRALLTPVIALGVPVFWKPSSTTTSFELRYEGEERELNLLEPGEPWSAEDVDDVGRAEWVQVGALTREEFPPAVLALLAHDRRLALDGQALVRPARTGPVRLDADFDEAVLRHVTVLKLAEAEAEVLGGEERLVALGVPEVLVTLGSRGALLLAAGRRDVVPVRRIASRDPTGAGDAFLAGYVWARACGHRPLSAARHAASTAARTLELAL